MAEKWTPPAFNNNATGWQYTTDPSGNRWQILTGGLYRNDEGVTTANPGQYSRRSFELLHVKNALLRLEALEIEGA